MLGLGLKEMDGSTRTQWNI